MINFTKFFLLAALTTIWGVTIAETPIEDNEYVIFYHNDVLGSPIAVSDGKGRVLWYENTDPYGEGLGRNSSDGITSVGNPIVESADNRIGYTGHEKDNTSGLTFMKARHYDPVISRFYSNDPAGVQVNYPQTFNRFSYVSNSPYRYIDPDGRNLVTAFGGFLSESWEGLTGRGDGEANYSNLGGALADGYNGEGAGVAASAFDDVASFGGGGAAAAALVKGFRITKGLFGGKRGVKGYRATSKAEADDIAKNGFRPDPKGGSMEDKWFSETKAGAEKIKNDHADLDTIIEADIPRDVYDRSFKMDNIDSSGTGFCVSCSDLDKITAQ